jgi:hypothetical protein
VRYLKRGGAVPLLVSIAATAAFAVPADVENVPTDRYFDVALNEIQQADSSIHLYMYLIALPPNRLGSKVYRLVDALVEAKERGVDVQVVLDRNINWTEESNLGFWDSAGKNAKAYRYLQGKGVEVYFDDEAIFTHAKALVIDKRIVILGSANWSESAFTRNVETSALIRSEEFAREILDGFRPLKLHAPKIGSSETIAVPHAFLNDKQLLGRMVTDHDERAFDAYLFLLRFFAGGEPGEEKVVGYGLLKEVLGVRGENEGNNRRAVRRVLDRLQDKYRLIAVSYKRGDEPAVALRAIEAKADRRQPTEIPVTYWEWRWNRELSFPGKVMLLLGEMYSSMSPTAPVWFRSTSDIAQRHGVSRSFVEDGLMELRRKNLVEVAPDRLDPEDYSDRNANRYAPNPLYDYKRLKQALQDLGDRYGSEKVEKARAYIAAVYEDSDIEGVERLILLEEEFGVEVVQQAVEVVSKMSGNNPKKTMAYLIVTIQGIGGRE